MNPSGAVRPDDIANRGPRWVSPQQARTMELDIGALRELLQQVPMEGQLPTRASGSVLSLPTPDGKFARFALVESPVMEAGLAVKYPQIRTFAGQGLDDASASLRLDVTPNGVHAQVLSANGESYVDPYQAADEEHYVVSAVLSSTSPGVTIFQANSTYPDIPSNGSQVNNVAYEVSTAANIACGTPVAFTHTVTYAGGGGPSVLNFNLPVGQAAATNYSFASVTGAVPPSGTSLLSGCQDDDAVLPVTLPAGFVFEFYGTPVTQLRADTNGVLVFNAGSVTSTAANGALPASAYAAPALFALWDDLDMSAATASGGGIYTQTSGTAPNRTFDVEWRAVRWVQGAATPQSPTLVFTVRLHETTNLIELYYKAVTGNGGGASGSSATVGIQGAGTGSVFTLYSNNTASISSTQKLTATRAAGSCNLGTNICGQLPNPIFANGFE